MSLTLELDPSQEREIKALAQSEGVSVVEYALRRLLPPHAISDSKKPLVIDRYDKGRDRQKTAAEIDAIVAEMEADRNSWDERERAWSHPTQVVQ
jgi:hypothetical protein